MDSLTATRSADFDMAFTLDHRRDDLPDVRFARLERCQESRSRGHFYGLLVPNDPFHHGRQKLGWLYGHNRTWTCWCLTCWPYNAVEQDIDTIDVIVLFKTNIKVHKYVRITSNIFWPLDSMIHTGSGSNQMYSSFIPLEWRDVIFSVYNASFRSASDSSLHAKRKIMLFARPVDLHVRVHFGIVDNLSVRLLIGKSISDKFVKERFRMEHFFVFIRSYPVVFNSDYISLSDVLALFRTDLNVECN